MATGYRDIYARIRQDILTGLLKPGDKVPSVRVLAAELQVARKTAETAYAILSGEGYLVSQGARGTRVNPELNLPAARMPAVPDLPEESKLASVVNIRDQQGFLRLGVPALDAFPTKKWLLLSGQALRSLPAAEMVNPPLMGYPPLREAIARYLNISRGLNCSPEQIFITSGYRNNLTLILDTLARENDKVVLEDPGYFFGQQLLKRAVKNLHPVPVDSQGMNVSYLLNHHPDARFVFVTPSHHSPLAVTLSLPRKH